MEQREVAVHQTPDDPTTEVVGYVSPAPWLGGLDFRAWGVVPGQGHVPLGTHTTTEEAAQAVREYRESGLTPLLCLLCRKPDHKHTSAVGAELQDHLSAAEFYGTCPGDVGVQHRLYPEAFPTPGPYVFSRCEFVERPDEECWHVTPDQGETLNEDQGFGSEAEAREWAAQYEPEEA